MGYTHYWKRGLELPKSAFAAIVRDFEALAPLFPRFGFELAGGFGIGPPRIGPDEIVFNGRRDCGHPADPLWSVITGEIPARTRSAARAAVRRLCRGDCSHETFYFPRVLDPDPLSQGTDGRYWDSTRTQYKPYDLAVACALIIARRHLKEALCVDPAGTAEQWWDAKLLCQQNLGYGLRFRLPEEVA